MRLSVAVIAVLKSERWRKARRIAKAGAIVSAVGAVDIVLRSVVVRATPPPEAIVHCASCGLPIGEREARRLMHCPCCHETPFELDLN